MAHYKIMLYTSRGRGNTQTVRGLCFPNDGDEKNFAASGATTHAVLREIEKFIIEMEDTENERYQNATNSNRSKLYL